MSIHSHTRIMVHMIWGTKRRQKLLRKPARKALSNYFYEYSEDKEIFMNVNYVNADHVHALIDLPTNKSVENVSQLFKGSSSRWINKKDLTEGKFRWGRGYGAFSVSESRIDEVVEYIQNQEEHHRTKTFMEEYRDFVEGYGLDFDTEIFT